MPSHYWGDEWFEKNGDDLYQAIRFCMHNWTKWGRIGTHGKEKYGTFRHHTYFFHNYEPCQELVYPGYVCAMFSNRFRIWDMKVLRPFFRYTGLAWLIGKWQLFVYNVTLQIACHRWPHITEELMEDCDAPLAVRPLLGFLGKVDGLEIHNRHWNPKLKRDGTYEKREEEDGDAIQD